MRCTHRKLEVKTERDRCSWVVCLKCGKQGPAKHSYHLAMLAWLVSLSDQRQLKPPPKRLSRALRVSAAIVAGLPKIKRNPFTRTVHRGCHGGRK